jgi:hypothetical protein
MSQYNRDSRWDEAARELAIEKGEINEDDLVNDVAFVCGCGAVLEYDALECAACAGEYDDWLVGRIDSRQAAGDRFDDFDVWLSQ